MKGNKKSTAMLIGAMVTFGTLGPFVRNIGVGSGELALYRAIMAALLIGAFLLIRREKIPFASIKKALPLLLISGMAMGIKFTDTDREATEVYKKILVQKPMTYKW